MADNEKELEQLVPEDEEEIDVGPFFWWLSTEKGHEIASKIVSIVDDVKKAALAQSASHARLEIWLKIVVILAVIGAATTLTIFDKFNPTVGVLFGTLVGYFVGRK